MQAILTAKSKASVLLFVSLGLLMAYFSTGVLHPDEHYQVLEFSRWLMGLPFSEPWEATQKLRHPLLPYIMMLWIKPMLALGINNPETIALGLRFFSFLINASIQWYCITKFAKKLFNHTQDQQRFTLYFILLPFFYLLWVRTSSENFSATSLLLSLTLMITSLDPRLHGDDNQRFKERIVFLLAGFFTFLCFSFRFAVATAWPAHFYILIQEAKLRRWHTWLWFSLGMLLGLLLFFVMEYRLYGVYFASPLAYLKFNVLSGAAGETFGHDWGLDFIKFLLFFLFPFNFLIFKKLLNKDTFTTFTQGPVFQILFPLFLACYFLTLIHFKVGHKEMRFLFPIIPCLYILLGYGVLKLNLLNKRNLRLFYLSQIIMSISLTTKFANPLPQIKTFCQNLTWIKPSQEFRYYSNNILSFHILPSFYLGAPHELWQAHLPNLIGTDLFTDSSELSILLKHFEVFLPKQSTYHQTRFINNDGWFYHETARNQWTNTPFYYLLNTSYQRVQNIPIGCHFSLAKPTIFEKLYAKFASKFLWLDLHQDFLLKCDVDQR